MVGGIVAHHHWTRHQRLCGIVVGHCEHFPPINMIRTKTFTLSEDQLRSILYVLASHRPELPEEMQKVQSVIDLMEIVPFNEGR